MVCLQTEMDHDISAESRDKDLILKTRVFPVTWTQYFRPTQSPQLEVLGVVGMKLEAPHEKF